MVSILQLTMYMKDHNMLTLKVKHAVEELLWSPEARKKARQRPDGITPYVMASLAFWVRAYLMPVLAGMGSAVSFAMSDNAQDVRAPNSSMWLPRRAEQRSSALEL